MSDGLASMAVRWMRYLLGTFEAVVEWGVKSQEPRAKKQA